MLAVLASFQAEIRAAGQFAGLVRAASARVDIEAVYAGAGDIGNGAITEADRAPIGASRGALDTGARHVVRTAGIVCIVAEFAIRTGGSRLSSADGRAATS